MGHFVDGQWREADASAECVVDGAFERAKSVIRHPIRDDPGAEYPAEPGRYHLYVSAACPWAHRAVIFRELKGLKQSISLSAVHPLMGLQGWSFEAGPGVIEDPVWKARYLRDIYAASVHRYSGRVTVPLVVDTATKTAVNNESSDIIRFFNTEFAQSAETTRWSDYDFYPPELRPAIDAVNARVYNTVNNGVYRAGFAKTQAAYDEAVCALFDTLDVLERQLATHRYLVGARLTEADWRLWVTLIRFDAVYHGHFKCNRARIVDYPNLWGYVRELFQIDNVAATVDFDHIAYHYYASHPSLNPSGIVPIGPNLDLQKAHGRGRLPADLP